MEQQESGQVGQLGQEDAPGHELRWDSELSAVIEIEVEELTGEIQLAFASSMEPGQGQDISQDWSRFLR